MVGKCYNLKKCRVSPDHVLDIILASGGYFMRNSRTAYISVRAGMLSETCLCHASVTVCLLALLLRTEYAQLV